MTSQFVADDQHVVSNGVAYLPEEFLVRCQERATSAMSNPPPDGFLPQWQVVARVFYNPADLTRWVAGQLNGLNKADADAAKISTALAHDASGREVHYVYLTYWA